MDMESRKFQHSGIIYEFKKAKRQEVFSNMPLNLREILKKYFNNILTNNIPHDIFNNKSVLRCSSFRIKGLKRGIRKKIYKDLIFDNKIGYISLDMKKNPYFSKEIFDLLQITNKIFQEYKKVDIKDFKPGHNEVLTKILLENNGALSIETPVWLRKQKKITDFMNLSHKLFSFSFSRPLTGHIDLLMYDPKDKSLVVVDYKPEGYFLRSLPQVATYALILKRILKIENIKCISFRKEDAIIYDPEILRTDIEKKLKQSNAPELYWRKIVRKI